MDGAFTALCLLLLWGVSAVSTVLPPANLTVSCHNLDVIARWNYSRQQPQTRFIVHVSGAAGEYKNETSDHHFNLTHFIWESESHYMEVHAVTVTAVQGGNQSKPVQSDSFTYNHLRPSTSKCKLLFPPAVLKVDDREASVSFRNPLHFYTALRQADKPDDVYFEYRVTTADGKNVTVACRDDQEICRREISLPEDGDKCVTLMGWLKDGIGRFVVFNETDPICHDTSADFLVTLLAVLLSILFLIIIAVTVSICMTKAWTLKREDPSLPASLQKPGKDHKLQFYEVKEEDFSAVKLIEDQTSRRLTVSSDDDDDDDNDLHGSSDGSDMGSGNYKVGPLESSDQEPGYSKADDDSADDSVKTECLTIDSEQEEEVERSPYDCPHHLVIHVDDGNMGKE